MSSEQRVQLLPAYVLHQRPYRNTSLLVDVLTRDRGRLCLVAKGARSMGSRWHGLLQPFRPLLVSWTGRHELGTLCDVEATAPGHRLQGRLLFSAYYLNELVLRLLPALDPHPQLFAYYLQAMTRLADLPPATAGTDPRHQLCLRIFEKYLLREIGYGLILDRAADTGAPIDAAGRYRYVLEIGPVAGDNTALGVEVSGQCLLALATDTMPAADGLQESKKLMRTVLGHYLGDKPLLSRSLLQQLEYRE